MAGREECVYRAKLAEQAERYDEMVKDMRAVATYEKSEQSESKDLSVEERNLLSVAYKNVIGARRASWRIVHSIMEKEKNEDKMALMKGYREKIEKELTEICDEVLDLLKNCLIPGACNEATHDSRVFYRKMMGDYYRYKAEIANKEEKTSAAQYSLLEYKEALTAAGLNLPTTHPIRLGLALNFSVFYYEIMNSPKEACALAKKAFDDAISDIDAVQEENYKDSTLIMQLLRDNLTLWTSDDSSQEQTVEDIEDEQ